jgi:hypothetical protein
MNPYTTPPVASDSPPPRTRWATVCLIVGLVSFSTGVITGTWGGYQWGYRDTMKSSSAEINQLISEVNRLRPTSD